MLEKETLREAVLKRWETFQTTPLCLFSLTGLDWPFQKATKSLQNLFREDLVVKPKWSGFWIYFKEGQDPRNLIWQRSWEQEHLELWKFTKPPSLSSCWTQTCIRLASPKRDLLKGWVKKKKINGALLELELKRHNGCKTDFLPELGFQKCF